MSQFLRKLDEKIFSLSLLALFSSCLLHSCKMKVTQSEGKRSVLYDGLSPQDKKEKIFVLASQNMIAESSLLDEKNQEREENDRTVDMGAVSAFGGASTWRMLKVPSSVILPQGSFYFASPYGVKKFKSYFSNYQTFLDSTAGTKCSVLKFDLSRIRDVTHVHSDYSRERTGKLENGTATPLYRSSHFEVYFPGNADVGLAMYENVCKWATGNTTQCDVSNSKQHFREDTISAPNGLCFPHVREFAKADSQVFANSEKSEKWAIKENVTIEAHERATLWVPKLVNLENVDDLLNEQDSKTSQVMKSYDYLRMKKKGFFEKSIDLKDVSWEAFIFLGQNKPPLSFIRTAPGVLSLPSLDAGAFVKEFDDETLGGYPPPESLRGECKFVAKSARTQAAEKFASARLFYLSGLSGNSKRPFEWAENFHRNFKCTTDSGDDTLTEFIARFEELDGLIGHRAVTSHKSRGRPEVLRFILARAHAFNRDFVKLTRLPYPTNAPTLNFSVKEFFDVMDEGATMLSMEKAWECLKYDGCRTPDDENE